jgi:hypothetical protein
MQAFYDISQTYNFTWASGLITNPFVAGTDSAGHIMAFRWTDSASDILIHRAAIWWVTTTAFGTAQELAVDLYIARNYSASHSGGTATDFSATNNGKRWTKQKLLSTLASAPVMQVCTTGELTDGTHDALGTVPVFRAGTAVAAAGLVNFEYNRLLTRDGAPPLRLSTNEGLILRNTIVFGATGAARVVLEMDMSLTPTL